MYKINTNVDKPDIIWMKEKVQELMDRGIKIKDCTDLLNMYKDDMERTKEVIITKYGIKNPNSNPQLQEYLKFESNKVGYGEVNDILNNCYDERSNKWTTEAAALCKLAELGYEFASDILDYRHAKKYFDSINGIVKARDSEGFVHPSISLAKTNRINYKEPGIMTIPKELLWDVVGEIHEGNSVFSIDIKNQEPHILISATGANDLKDALESEDGVYETVFRKCFQPIAIANVLFDTFNENRVYKVSEIEKVGFVSPAMYFPAKPFIKDTYYNGGRVKAIETICIGSEKGVKIQNILPSKVSIETENGNIYDVDVEWKLDGKESKKGTDYAVTGLLIGMTIDIGEVERKEFKTAWNALTYGGSIQIATEICKHIDASQTYHYLTKIEQIKNYNKMIEQKARAGERFINTIFGTCLDAGWSKNWRELKRTLLDIPIQGTGADILALLLKRFYDYTKENNLDKYFELVYTRNDELVIEIDKGYMENTDIKEIEHILRDMLEHQINDWVPFKIEIKQVV